MRKEITALTKRRLLLLSKIGKAADEIKRIDIRLKSISGDMIVMSSEIDHSSDGLDPNEVKTSDLIDGNLIELEIVH